jgi:ATP-dependent RNA helicase DHX57
MHLCPACLLQGWRNAPPGALEAAAAADDGLGAILIFMPGAPEIDRLVRQLQGSSRLSGAVGRAGGVRVLPLHGGLPSAVQVRSRPVCGG